MARARHVLPLIARARIFVRMVAVVVAAAFMLVTMPPKPANADILACLNALTGVESAFKVVTELADPDFLMCSQQMAAGDVAMIATVALIVGAGQAGAFNSEATCNNMVVGPLGQFIAGILTSAGPVSAALESIIGKDNFKNLVEFAKDEAAGQLANIAPLQPIFSYMNCGCKVYGKAQALASVADGWLDDVKECAGVIGDVGKALLNLVESGADAVGELFGHERDQTPATMLDNYPQCGTWQFFPDSAKITLGPGGSGTAVSEIKSGLHTEKNTCQCDSPSRLETKDAFEGKIAVRCACDAPPNSIYTKDMSKNKPGTCGCSADMKLQGGSCVACDTETRTENAQGITLFSGYVSKGICQRVSKVCAPGTTPAKSPGAYYQACQPVCDKSTFFVKASNGVGGSCQSCPVNFVPTEKGQVIIQLQCEECPRGFRSGPGGRECVKLECANGVDLQNPHACKPVCALEGEGNNRRLVCRGAAIDSQLPGCAAGMVMQAGRCVPEIYHKPDDVIVQDGMDTLRLPKRPTDIVPQTRRQRLEATPRLGARVPPERRVRSGPRRDPGRDELVGPADDGGSVPPPIGDIIDFGIGIGRGLNTFPGATRDRNGGSSGGTRLGGSATEAVPQMRDAPSIRRMPAPDTQMHQKN